jgi:hypothetical protein
MQVMHVADHDKHGAGLDVPAASQSDDFIFYATFLFGKVS